MISHHNTNDCRQFACRIFRFLMTVLAGLLMLLSSAAAVATDSVESPTDSTHNLSTPPAPGRAVAINPVALFDSRAINADLELGFLAWTNYDVPTRFFGRVMVGMLRAKDPVFASANIGIDIGGLRTAAIGAHFLAHHLVTGFFAHGFYAVTPKGESILGASLGWSIIGVEGQVLPESPHDRLVLFKLKIPFGIAMYGIHNMARDVSAQSRSRKRSLTDTP